VAAHLLFDAIRTPFCVFNDEPERLATQLAIAMYLESDRPGQNLLAAVRAFEPHPLWRREFLQLRNDCYSTLQDRLAEQSRRDLDAFMRHAAATADVSTLTKKIQTGSARSGSP
jgi:hypothetical protein